MPSFTKKAIVDSFMALASKKPLEKITVRDIVDHCGINRNTFYYYFQDIYAVLEEICQVAIDSLPEEATLTDTLCAFFNTMVHFTKKYPRAAKGLALSFGFEGMGRYFGKALDGAILACLARDKSSITLPEHQQKTLALFLRHAVIGFCLELMCDQKNADPEQTTASLAAVMRTISLGLGKN